MCIGIYLIGSRRASEKVGKGSTSNTRAKYEVGSILWDGIEVPKRNIFWLKCGYLGKIWEILDNNTELLVVPFLQIN